LRKARDLLHPSGGAISFDSKEKNHPTEEGDVNSCRNKSIVILGDSFAKLLDSDNAAAKLFSSSSLNCYNKVDDESVGVVPKEDSVTAMGNKIIKLVAKIINDRANNALSTENKDDQMTTDHAKKSPHVILKDEDKNPSDGIASNLESLDYEDLEKSSFSVTSITYHRPFIVDDVTKNLVIKGDKIDNDDDNENTSCSSGARRAPREATSASCRASNDNEYLERVADEENYSDEYGQEVAGEGYYSDEDVEYPPLGYHGFSPPPSFYSQSPTPSSRRTSSSSEKESNKNGTTLLGNRLRRSNNSDCSSYLPSSTENQIAAMPEVDEEEFSDVEDITSRVTSSSSERKSSITINTAPSLTTEGSSGGKLFNAHGAHQPIRLCLICF
jgi:hypothetical protein